MASLETHGPFPTSSGHAVKDAVEPSVNVLMITIVVNIIIYALFQLLEGSKGEKPRINIVNQLCTL